MISSKEIILNKLTNSKIGEIPLPDLEIINTFVGSEETAAEKFSKMLSTVGGKAVLSESSKNLEALIIDQGVKPDLENTVSLSKFIFQNQTRDYSKLDIPTLSHIDYAIVDAEFGVAENGAVWIPESKKAHRSVLFIVQHLIVILDKTKIVKNMHEAYKLLGAEDTFSKPSFGTFISGPSKTADIEQSLVIGAHGPRSHTVYLT